MEAPTLEVYEKAKAACGDALLLFRFANFYEAFYDDALMLARVGKLLVTSPDDSNVPMCGFPVHQLDARLKALIAAGERVAVCDSVEDEPKEVADSGQKRLF